MDGAPDPVQRRTRAGAPTVLQAARARRSACPVEIDCCSRSSARLRSARSASTLQPTRAACTKGDGRAAALNARAAARLRNSGSARGRLLGPGRALAAHCALVDGNEVATRLPRPLHGDGRGRSSVGVAATARGECCSPPMAARGRCARVAAVFARVEADLVRKKEARQCAAGFDRGSIVVFVCVCTLSVCK